MPLTKSQIIPPTRRELGQLQELVDNRRQIRAREYERNRRKIALSNLELLQNVEKPLVNVLKGLFEDTKTWNIRRKKDGTIDQAKLAWGNISPLLQQLNRMDSTEAVEVLADVANKLPNALTEQREIIGRLGALIAGRGDENITTVEDLDRHGLLTPLQGAFGDLSTGMPRPVSYVDPKSGKKTRFMDAIPSTREHPIEKPERPVPHHVQRGERKAREYAEEEAERAQAEQRRLRPADLYFTGHRDRYDPQTYVPPPSSDYSHPGAADAAPPPMPTPARPSQSGVDAGLPQSGTYVSMGRLEADYPPEVLNYLGDILSLSPEQVAHTHARATELAQSGTPLGAMELGDMKASPLGRRLAEVVEIMREARGSQGRAVSERAHQHQEAFADAMRLARDIRDTPTQQEVVARYGSVLSRSHEPQTSAERQREYGDLTEQYLEGARALPYEAEPEEQFTGLADAILSERQPFRAGMPVAPPIPEAAFGGIRLPEDELSPARLPEEDTEFSLLRHRPSGAARPPPPAQAYVHPPAADKWEEAFQRFDTDTRTRGRQQRDFDKELLREFVAEEIPEQAEGAILQTPSSTLTAVSHQSLSPYYTAQSGNVSTTPTTATREANGMINLFGAKFPPSLFTATAITLPPLGEGQPARRFPITPNMWKVLMIKNLKAIKAVPLTPQEIEGIDKLAGKLRFKGWETSEKRKEIINANTALGEVVRRRGRRVPQAALEELIPQEHQLEGMPLGIGEDVGMVGRGVKAKKWHPLKLGAGGELGEVQVSMPDLINNLELVVKRRDGGKVMMRKKGVPIDLLRLLTRRYNPKSTYNDNAKDLYKKIVTMAKVPLGQSYSQKENIMGTGIKVPVRTETQHIIDDAKPSDVMDRLVTDLGTMRNGNRSSILKNSISASADFLLKHDMIDKSEHKMIMGLIKKTGKKYTEEEKEFLQELFN